MLIDRTHIEVDICKMIACKQCGWMEMLSSKCLQRRTKANVKGMYLYRKCKVCGSKVTYTGLNFTGHEDTYYRLKK